ncbi:MAG: cache domain-containing protein [Candidatus Omnitrophica bacterium]|nr:cache domain-containing protein [Candidatus Omnitrophota bacterium]
MVRKVLLCLACAVLIVSVSRCFAEEMTLTMVKQKVNDAVRMLATDGKEGFAKIKDPDGEFRFGNGRGYIWIHDLQGWMIVHPTQPHLEGTMTIDMQDSRGFRFIAAMNKLVAEHEQGWVAYLWPKPGRQDEAYKVAFVKKAMVDGEPYVVGCGMYDVGIAEVKQQFPNDALVKF